LRIDFKQPPRLLIGGAAHHDAVDVLKMARRVRDRSRCAAIDGNAKLWIGALEPIDALIVEWRECRGFSFGERARRSPGPCAPCTIKRIDRFDPTTASANASSDASGSWLSMPMAATSP